MTMLFNFMLSAHVFLALARHSAVPLCNLVEGEPRPPANGQWLNFLRNLDELSLERLPAEQQEAVFDVFAPDPDMRIFNRGIRRRLAPLLGGSRSLMELALSLLFTLPGSPLLMYGDEIGMGDDLSLPGRNAVRTPMQWSSELNAGFSVSEALIAPVIKSGPYAYPEVNVHNEREDGSSFLNWVKKLIALRKEYAEIGVKPIQLIDTEEEDSRVLVHSFPPRDVQRDRHPVIFFHNLADQEVDVSIRLRQHEPAQVSTPLGSGKIVCTDLDRLEVRLPKNGYLWVCGLLPQALKTK